MAVLIRALQPLAGLNDMRTTATAARRTATRRTAAPPVPERDLCRGPGRLCRALGLDGSHDGVDLLAEIDGLALEDDGWRPAEISQGPRVVITAAVDRPWR